MVDVTRAKEKYRNNTTAESFINGLEEYGGGDINDLQEKYAADVVDSMRSSDYSRGVANFINSSDDPDVNVSRLNINDAAWGKPTATSNWSGKVVRAGGEYSVESNKSSNEWFEAYADAFTQDNDE